MKNEKKKHDHILAVYQGDWDAPICFIKNSQQIDTRDLNGLKFFKHCPDCGRKIKRKFVKFINK